MTKLEPFTRADFEAFLAWIDTEEILTQIAGHYFTYPLSCEQLDHYLDDEQSNAFKIVSAEDHKPVGHAEIYKSTGRVFKIDKFFIDPSRRGMGLGLEAMQRLLSHCFDELEAQSVELFVFEQNVPAIQCYKKAGFVFEDGPKMPFKLKDQNWYALKMVIDRQKWLERSADRQKN
jgi:RimJ/RimL family protein N-acetyltransferase